MCRKQDLRLIGVAVCASTAMLTSISALPQAPLPTYQLLDIGTLGGNSASAVDINDRGEVTGSAATAAAASHAFIYKDGLMVDLGMLKADRYGMGNSQGADINERGEVAGVSDTQDGFSHAFRYSNGALTDLGTLGGIYSSANAINEAGQVSGISSFQPGSSDYHGFLHGRAGMTDLGTLGDSYSTGDRLNDAGQVAGIYQLEFQTHAYLYTQGSMIDLVPGTLSYVSPTAVMINAAGHVSGSYRIETTRSFLWRDGEFLDLGTLGGDFSNATALNDTDQVVGDSTEVAGESHAYRWSAGELTDLGTLGGTYSNATAINEAGQVTGQALTVDVEYHPFVYSNGAMIDLGIPQNGVHGIGRAINAAGQVVGQYQLLTGDPFEPYFYRSFLATPITLLFTRLEVKATAAPGRILESSVRLAQRYYQRSDLKGTCAVLSAVIFQGGLLSYNKKLAAKMQEVMADARAIKSAVGCRSGAAGSDASTQDEAPAVVLSKATALSADAKAQALAAYKERLGIDARGLLAVAGR